MAHKDEVLLILGAGKKIGDTVAKAAIEQGYLVASVSRSAGDQDNTEKQIFLSADLSKPESVAKTFEEVTSKLGTPSVVVYNAAVGTPGDEKNPLQLPTDDLVMSLNVNTISAYAAAQEAVKGFEKLPDTASKTFIYTGNFLNTAVVPPLVQIGMSKTAAAHLIEAAATAYAGKYRFCYADERQEDGSGMWEGTGGQAAADHYLHLAESAEQQPWLQTFVDGKGYKDFSKAKR